VFTHVRPWRPRDRRPGHPAHRTVGGTHRPGHPRPWARPPRPWSTTRGDRCRAGLPGRRSGAAGRPRRASLAAGRPHPGGTPVPRLLSQSEDNQRLKDLAPRLEAGLWWLAGHDPGVGGAAAAAGRHPGGLRPVHHHRQALEAVRLCRLRLRVLPQPLLLGVKLLVVVTADGTVTGFGLANPSWWVNAKPSSSCWVPSRPTVHQPAAPW
jgi:hypothetical protein